MNDKVKNILIILFSCFYCPALFAQPKIKLDSLVYNLKNIQQYSATILTIPFTNIGDSPLVITDARSTNTHSMVDRPQQPVLPGKTGLMKISILNYNPGRVINTFSFYTNEPGREGVPTTIFVHTVVIADTGNGGRVMRLNILNPGQKMVSRRDSTGGLSEL